jgi:HlyD family secretion protein
VAASLVVLVFAAGAALAWVRSGRRVQPLPVRRADLVLSVEVEGELTAVRSTDLGPPALPGLPLGDFKIASLAPESALVRRGQPVISFDAQVLLQQREERRAEVAEVRQTLEQRRIDLSVKRLDLELRLAQTEAALAKARLKADVPTELSSRLEARLAALDVAVHESTLAGLKAEKAATESGAEAERRTLESRQRRAAGRLAAIEAAIRAMSVVAPQDGIVIYKSDWNGNKKRVGDSVWLMEKVLSLPDLSEIKADGDVDEADAGRLTTGQRVTLRLEARPDLDIEGRVASIGRSVRRKSPRVPSKVYRVEIHLARTDPTYMRPAMRFRGEIETARFAGLLVVPRETVCLRATGPVVWVRGPLGWSERAVRLGRGNRRLVEVLAGLDEGEQISPIDLARDAGDSAGSDDGLTRREGA